MRAALALLGQMPVGPLGRRIAVLGDMLELGDSADTLHRELADPVTRQCGRSCVLLRARNAKSLAGSSLRAPGRLCGGVRARSSRRCWKRYRAATPSWSKARWVRRWARSSNRCSAITRRHLSRSPRPRKVDCHMLYWLVDLSDKISALNVFRYITFRTGGAMMTALIFVFLSGSSDHRYAAPETGPRPADPQRRPAIAPEDQARHADHGRIDDPVRRRALDHSVGQSGQSLCLDRADGDDGLRRHRLL